MKPLNRWKPIELPPVHVKNLPPLPPPRARAEQAVAKHRAGGSFGRALWTILREGVPFFFSRERWRR